MTQDIHIQGQHFVLHPYGAAFWKEESMLLVADVHLGKVTHFRKHGSAVPQQALYENFEKLDKLLDFFNPKRLCFLGDLFHSYVNTEWEFFAAWAAQCQCEIWLVTGNHDIISPALFEGIGIELFEELQIGNFILTHHPEEQETAFNFCGHIHPAIILKGKGKQSLRLSCFFQRENQMIFPAFGTFTGTHCLDLGAKDKAYVIVQEEVIEVN